MKKWKWPCWLSGMYCIHPLMKHHRLMHLQHDKQLYVNNPVMTLATSGWFFYMKILVFDYCRNMSCSRGGAFLVVNLAYVTNKKNYTILSSNKCLTRLALRKRLPVQTYHCWITCSLNCVRWLHLSLLLSCVLIEPDPGCRSHHNSNLLVPSTLTGLSSSSVQRWQWPEPFAGVSAVLGSKDPALCHLENLLDTIQAWEGGTAGRKGYMAVLFTSGEDGIVAEC